MTRDKVELTANISVIVSAVLFCFVLFSNYILPSHTGEKHQVTGRAEGTTLKLDGVNWQDHKQSLVMAISTHCSYCIRSIPFYQRLSNEAAAHHLNATLIAALPDNLTSSKSFLSSHQIHVDEISQAQLSDLGVDGTPTLLLVDNRGKVKHEWVGLLNPDAERQVISQIGM